MTHGLREGQAEAVTRPGGSGSPPPKPRVWHKNDGRAPRDAVYIGRPSKWGNPFKIGYDAAGRWWDRDEVIVLYAEWLKTNRPELIEAAKTELRGKHLMCWCKPLACHGDVLLRVANED